jgi:hypothetical protein
MKTITRFSVVLVMAALWITAAYPDILVLNNGQALIGKVSVAASGRYKLSTEYGEQFFDKSDVASFWVTSKGMEAESYYQAGVLVMSKGQRETARQLFELCVRQDASYRDKCVAALRGGPSAVAPTPSSPGAPVATTPVIGPPEPQGQLLRIQCPECSGSGVIMGSSRLSQESGKERPRPCPICGGKGYKDLLIPPGYELCSNCGGFGATMGSGGGSGKEGGFTVKKDMCAMCAGRGYVKAPWKPTEQIPGTEGSGTVMTSTSPSPGTAPPRGVANIVRDRAHNVASGSPPSRPIGPSGVRPVSPTVLEDSSSGNFTSGGSGSSDQVVEEEVVDEGAGSSSGSATEETSKESESKEASDSSNSYEQPGLMGKINKYKWYVVLGGCVLLVFAMVLKKTGAKK